MIHVSLASIYVYMCALSIFLLFSMNFLLHIYTPSLPLCIAAVIHTTVHASHNFFHRIGRFTKWGPSITGLSIIPLLPMYLDGIVEEGLETIFHNYGPWAHKDKHD